MKSVVQRRAVLPVQSELSHLPPELQRLFQLVPLSRHCFVLRIPRPFRELPLLAACRGKDARENADGIMTPRPGLFRVS